MENSKPDSDNASAPKSGPGRLLRQARLDLRLAPEDVAQILHLSSKQIMALEADDYQHLPGPTYIRGYLRSYAQLLGLVPEKVVDTYNSLMISAKPVSLPLSAPPPQITSSDHLVKAASVGVAVVVLGLVYLWWQSEEDPLDQFQAPAIFGQADVEKQVLPNAADEKPADVELANVPGGGEPATSPGPAPVGSVPGSAATSGQMTVSGMTLNVSPAEPPRPATTPSPPAPPAAEPVMTRTRRVAEIPAGVPRSRLVLH
ncbi:MAG: helix-turn-helix domain-containing protein, partial [Gammaproteobacteria bacterium]|nr:helix-turn-helix domain-containing protein [Gammaproteobacteria bacterium]